MVRRTPYVLVVFAAALVVTLSSSAARNESRSPSSHAVSPLPTKPMPASERARISAVVREVLSGPGFEGEIPGLVIGIWSPTQGVYKASFGRSNLTSSARPKLDSRFRVGSVSKTFTATVILQLVDEGRLSLTGRVRTYLPALARRYPAIGTRTVAQLLGMRSGLPEYADAAVKQVTTDTDRVWTANRLIALGMRSGPVKRAGGRNSVYTNTNYVILGQIAEAVTGKRFDRLVRERLIEPLGLRHTVYPAPTDASLPAPFTHGYVGPSGAEEITKLGGTTAAGADVTGWNPSWGNAAGMMISTIDDLARWSNTTLGNALLSPKLQKQRLATVPMDFAFTYGLGILKLVGGRWIGHEGGIPGWTTWALRDAKTGTVVVTSVNACCGGTPSGLTLDLLKRLYPETVVIGAPLKGGETYVLSPTTSITPQSGWTISTGETIKNISLKAVKPGVVFDVSDVLEIPEDQTFASRVTVLHDSEAGPGKALGALTPFTTTSGLQGFTYTTRSLAESTQTWFVTNGKKIARLDVQGSAASVKAVTAEMTRMARSITMAPPGG